MKTPLIQFWYFGEKRKYISDDEKFIEQSYNGTLSLLCIFKISFLCSTSYHLPLTQFNL